MRCATLENAMITPPVRVWAVGIVGVLIVVAVFAELSARKKLRDFEEQMHSDEDLDRRQNEGDLAPGAPQRGGRTVEGCKGAGTLWNEEAGDCVEPGMPSKAP